MWTQILLLTWCSRVLRWNQEELPSTDEKGCIQPRLERRSTRGLGVGLGGGGVTAGIRAAFANGLHTVFRPIFGEPPGPPGPPGPRRGVQEGQSIYPRGSRSPGTPPHSRPFSVNRGHLQVPEGRSRRVNQFTPGGPKAPGHPLGARATPGWPTPPLGLYLSPLQEFLVPSL